MRRLVTVSEFTDQAKDFVSELEVPLQLIDGRQLFELVSQHWPDALVSQKKGN
ncbi:MAG: restriction endonuclease [Chloroflexi bacterium]|nr:restriction endonuclease [Chloroflexota bacterium]